MATKNGGPSITGLTVEYSRLQNTAEGKVFNVNWFTNVTIRNNEIIGGEDWHFMNGELDGFLSEDNYYHEVVGSASSHSDGFQIAEFEQTSGTITMRGNWFEKDNDVVSPTDLLFATGSDSSNQTTIVWENNLMYHWGRSTLQCYNSNACHILNNVYAQEFKDTWFPADSGRKAALFQSKNVGTSSYHCNRYEDGTFVPLSRISQPGGLDFVIAGCPSLP